MFQFGISKNICIKHQKWNILVILVMNKLLTKLKKIFLKGFITFAGLFLIFDGTKNAKSN